MDSTPFSLHPPGQYGTAESIGRIEETGLIDDARAQHSGHNPIIHATGTRTYQHIHASGHTRQHNGDVYVLGHYYEPITEELASKAALDSVAQDVALIKQLLETSAISTLNGSFQPLMIIQSSRLLAKEDDRMVRRPRRRESHRESSLFVIRLRPWFLSKLWQVSMARSKNGWKANLQVWNVVPDDSLIFEYARAGDLEGIVELVESGLASPFDLDDNGDTFAQHAARYGQRDRGLLLYYMDTTQADVYDTFLSFFRGRLLHFNFLRVLVDEYELILHDLSNILDADEPPWTRSPFDPECDLVDIVRKALPSRNVDLPLQTMIAIEFGFQEHHPQTFIRVTGLDYGTLASLTDEFGRTAMHVAAENFENPNRISNWESLVRTYHDHELDLHALMWDSHRSPFMDAVYWNHERIQIWAQMLFNAGVDLVGYGRNEHELWQSSCGFLRIEPVHGQFFIVDFVFGPMPRDWQLVVRPFIDISLYRTVRLPGSWYDEKPAKFYVDRICWTPDECETAESIWIPEQPKRITFGRQILQSKQAPKMCDTDLLWFRGLDFRGSATQTVDNMMAYDDSAPIVLMLQRPRVDPVRRRRSSSQPRPNQLVKHDELQEFHMCFLSYPPEIHYHCRGTPEARDCIRGYHDDHDEYWRMTRQDLETWPYTWQSDESNDSEDEC